MSEYLVPTYKKFNSYSEARDFCLSEEFDRHLSSLQGTYAGLIEACRDEQTQYYNHGNLKMTQSENKAAYVNSEISRLKGLRRYFKKEKPSPGYKWKYKDGNVEQNIDTRNLRKKHPVFKSYIKSQKRVFTDKEFNEAYEMWVDSVLRPSLNNMFKMAYVWAMRDLIPEGGIKFIKN